MVDRDVVFDIYVSLAHIRVLDEVIPHFMLYFINSPVAKKQFNKRLKGSGVPNLHLEEIREVIIPFPQSKETQQTIVRQLDALRAETQKLEAVYQKKINDLEELKKSILQKAFSGGLNLDLKDSQITTITKKSSHQLNQA
jgi:type I restriction enzyme, S subunit